MSYDLTKDKRASPEVIVVANWKTEHDIKMEFLNLKLKFFNSPPLSEVCQTPYSTNNNLLVVPPCFFRQAERPRPHPFL